MINAVKNVFIIAYITTFILLYLLLWKNNMVVLESSIGLLILNGMTA